MEELTAVLIRFVSDQDNLVGLSVLAGAALVEYVFPPFPGDTITLFGAVLITSHGWSAPLVLLAVLCGALVGTSIDWAAGRWLRRSGKTPARWRPRIDRMTARFERHGNAYLFVARFLPAMRALSCVAAGLAGMRLPTTLLWSGLATLLYNVILIGIGSAVGANLDELRGFVAQYTSVAWLLLAIALGGAALLWLVRRRRRAATSNGSRGEGAQE